MFGGQESHSALENDDKLQLQDATDVLIDVVDEDGSIRWMSAAEADLLGVNDVNVLTIDSVYDFPSAERIRNILMRGAAIGFSTTLELQLLGRAGRPIRTVGRATIVSEGSRRGLRLSKIELGPVGAHYDQLVADATLLSSILFSAKEAHWAIVFLEPVDITQSREEIIRQVFENQSIWRMCNPAMARAYGLPEDIDFNKQSVRLYWPRSPENESFVGHIIDGGYAVDDAVSVDRKHDGTAIYISNDVRSRIVDGYLTHLWGNIRNVTELSEARRKLGMNGEGV